jgi:hypothetical protein
MDFTLSRNMKFQVLMLYELLQIIIINETLIQCQQDTIRIRWTFQGNYLLSVRQILAIKCDNRTLLPIRTFNLVDRAIEIYS